jgi:hypothetical protein
VVQLADDLGTKLSSSVQEVATRWLDMFWPAYAIGFADQIRRAKVYMEQ